MGKAYANKKTEDERPENDFYPTPGGLTLELLNTGVLSDCHTILEPCCGQYAISKILEKHGFEVTSRDLIYGNDFLKDDYSNEHYDAIVTNPPFDLYNDIINKAKTIDCKKIIAIGRTNYFASHNRNVEGFWKGLSDVYIFDRQVEYRTPQLDIPDFCVGALCTGWFLWTKGYTGDPRIHILDVQKYATLGSVENYLVNCLVDDVLKEDYINEINMKGILLEKAKKYKDVKVDKAYKKLLKLIK